MYEIDPKFFNEDGTLNVEKAMAAGRSARAQAAKHGSISGGKRREIRSQPSGGLFTTIEKWLPFAKRTATT